MGVTWCYVVSRKNFGIEGEILNMETVGSKKFSVFIKALYNEAGGVQCGFIDDLFKTLDIDIEGIDGLIKNWMAGRNQSYKGYFKGKNFNQKHYDNFLRFLDEKINKRFITIKSVLKTYSDEYLYIDFETDNQETFFESLLNQFKEIVGLPIDPNVVPFVRSKDTNNNQKKAPQNETPSEQMRKIFEQAVAHHSITGYMCKVADYLIDKPFYSVDIFNFIGTIQTTILEKFVNNQDEEIFKKITEFKIALESYCAFLGMIQTSISECYGFAWRMSKSYDGIIELIRSNKAEMGKALAEEQSMVALMSEEDIESKSAIELKTKINQLNFIESIFLRHKDIDSLYSEICNGKTLLVY